MSWCITAPKAFLSLDSDVAAADRVSNLGSSLAAGHHRWRRPLIGCRCDWCERGWPAVSWVIGHADSGVRWHSRGSRTQSDAVSEAAGRIMVLMRVRIFISDQTSKGKTYFWGTSRSINRFLFRKIPVWSLRIMLLYPD